MNLRIIFSLLGLLGFFLSSPQTALSSSSPHEVNEFIDRYCLDCHDTDMKKGDLDLIVLPWNLDDPATFAKWVLLHDRVEAGEMPPKKKDRPDPQDLTTFLSTLNGRLRAAEEQRLADSGRATQRRLNRYEYENTLRDVLALPYLEVKDFLPEDTVAHGFNKIGDALDVSHVQMARYLKAADFALREAMAPQAEQPETTVTRFPTWDQREFFGRIDLAGPRERRTFPLIGLDLQLDLMKNKPRRAPRDRDPAQVAQEAMAVVVSTYEPTEIRFGRFKAPVSGMYRLRLSAYSIWMSPTFDAVTRGRRTEPVTLYSDTPPRLLRKLGGFDVGPEPTIGEMEVWLMAGETIRPDAARLFRSRPPDHKNPLTEADGMPGVAFQWLEVEGPLITVWPPPSHRVLFGDLALEDLPGEDTPESAKRSVRVVSEQPNLDSRRLIRQFMGNAYRRPVPRAEVARFHNVVLDAMKTGLDFTEAMLTGYTAILSSPGFLYFQGDPGTLKNLALAERLAYFLWNSPPDDELRGLAVRGELQQPGILQEQTDRLLDDPKSRRFVDAFLAYWLDLRLIAGTAPDTELYPDYQLDDLLVESITEETQLFFLELLRRNLGVTNLVDSTFAMLNERLATHYDMGEVQGIDLRRVEVPSSSVRGGLLTQASVLKVTANGTTTSPVKRGAWIMDRILGMPPPPPPPSVPAVEPDIRGATTIREQLAKHRSQESCNACHRKIDPAGFALENFDVMGGWRERYRVLGGGDRVKGIGHNGLYYHFGLGPKVDASGELPDGPAFHDIRELKQALRAEDKQLARNLVRQLATYATGAPIRFSDREAVEKILSQSAASGYGVRTMVHEIVRSELFRRK